MIGTGRGCVVPVSTAWLIVAGCGGAPHGEPVAPDAPCEACAVSSGCAVLRDTPVTAASAPGFGLFVRDGEVRCDPEAFGCEGPLGAEGQVHRLLLTDACDLWQNEVFVTPEAVFEQSPMSVGQSGGPGFGLPRLPLHAKSIRFLGRGFTVDDTHVFDRTKPVAADARTFVVFAEACPCIGRDKLGSLAYDATGQLVRVE